ncbi:MAG: 6-phosphogluconolactonase [Mangrovibacterium sp.]
MIEREICVLPTAEDAAEALALRMERLIGDGRVGVHIALSGGTTSIAFLNALVKRERINWTNVNFWWVDERCVLPDDEQSNFRLFMEFFYERLSFTKPMYHRVKGEFSVEDACFDYVCKLEKAFNNECPHFDLIILGIGEDGHIASIFPQNIDSFYADSMCVVAKHPQTGQYRVSFTGKVINAATQVAFLVSGKHKSGIIKRVFSENSEELPAQLVSLQQGKLLFFLDKYAAEEI